MGWSDSKIFAIAMVTILLGVACKRQDGVVDGADSGQSSCNKPPDLSPSGTPETVTFYGDLSPILRSNFRGKVFKCTTCHAEYNDPKSLINVAELTRVIDSMKNGRMPRGGDSVPPALIQLFSEWRIQGFKVGVANQGPSRSGISAGVLDLYENCSTK